MARDHFISPVVPDEAVVAVRYGAGTGAVNQVTQAEVGKFSKLVAESRYDNCAAGDAIEGVVYSIELAPQNGYTIGGVLQKGRVRVTFDGIQADGTGVIAINDLVVAGAAEAKGTVNANGFPKVRKATAQTVAKFNWRVVSLGPVGTGAVGTVGVIERI